MWIRAFRALHGPETAVSRTVVGDPEDAASIILRRSSHDLLDEAVLDPTSEGRTPQILMYLFTELNPYKIGLPNKGLNKSSRFV